MHNRTGLPLASDTVSGVQATWRLEVRLVAQLWGLMRCDVQNAMPSHSVTSHMQAPPKPPQAAWCDSFSVGTTQVRVM